MRAEILVHDSRNWDFTKIPNNMREKEAFLRQVFIFPDKKHTAKQPLQKVCWWHGYFYKPSFLAMGLEEQAATRKCNVRGIPVYCGSRDLEGQKGEKLLLHSHHSWRYPDLALPRQAEEKGLSLKLNTWLLEVAAGSK